MDHATAARHRTTMTQGRSRFCSIAAALLAAMLYVLMSRPCAALDADRRLTQALHRIWQVQQGLPDPTIYSLRQSSDGYILLATQTGPVRFDGVRFTPIVPAGNASPEKIWARDLLEEPDRTVWIGTDGSGLFCLRVGKSTHYTVADGLPADRVRRVFRDSHENLWICTTDGLGRLTGGHFTAYRDSLPSTNLRAVCETKDGHVLFGGDGSQLGVWDGLRFSVLVLSSVPPNAVVRALHCQPDGTIWVGTSSGLVRIQDGKERRFTTSDGLADDLVYCIAPASDGGLWIGTKDGFSRLHRNELESFRSRDGLSQSTVYTLCEDREGSLWVGTKHGLNQFLDRRLVPYTASEGLASNDTGPVFQDTAGNIWIGTLGAGLNLFDGRQFSGLTTAQGLASNVVYSLQDDSAGNLWIGSDKGLTRLHEGGAARVFGTADGLPAPIVRCIVRSRDGELWFGTAGGLAVMRNDQLTTVTSFPNESIVAMAERGQGMLIATEGGSLYQFEDGKPQVIPRKTASATRDIDAFWIDRDGLVWIGSIGDGLTMLDKDTTFSFSMRDGLFDTDIFGIVSDDEDRLWMACSKGIFWIRRSDLVQYAKGQGRKLVSTPFSPTEALRTIECKARVHPGVSRMKDGRIWFSTTRGVIVVDPPRMQQRLSPPPVVVEEVMVNGVAQRADTIINLPPGQKNIELSYAGLSLLVPNRITFRYKLEGFDRDWVEAGTRREAFYTNLPPGSYRFRVAARNVDGLSESAESAVDFGLASHYYQRKWFLPLCAAVLAFWAWLVYRNRVRQIKMRLAAILAERTRIARELHDTLIQGFSGVTMEMQALSAQLASSPERTTLKEIIRDAGMCLREARQSVAGLRHPEGHAETRPTDLAAAITRSAEQLTEARDVRLRLQLRGPTRLDDEVEYHLLRIAQEAVANAVKHARARSIDVTLDSSDHALTLGIKDDGCGFSDPVLAAGGTPPGHYGLIGMKERAAQIGAELRIESAPGRGTHIQVVLPFVTDDSAVRDRTRAPSDPPPVAPSR